MFRKASTIAILAFMAVNPAIADNCSGTALSGIRGLGSARVLTDGAIIGRAKANINIDGSGRAYHPQNKQADALIHLCNAGKVYLPNGSSYHGSESNGTCTGKFMRDFTRIRGAGWNDPRTGAISWYGILGAGTARISGKTVSNVVPAAAQDGSGFFVSPTALFDPRIGDPTRQERYVDPMKVPAAVIPSQDALRHAGVVMGSFGVALDPKTGKAVPFITGDYGPRVGEATPALVRKMAGLPQKDEIAYSERYQGQVDEPRIVWVFFGKAYGRTDYDSDNPEKAGTAARQAFEKWGGVGRLRDCLE